MTDTFNPTISYRVAGFNIDQAWIHDLEKQTPWERLRNWEQADKGTVESTTEYITIRLQEQWPGNYKVVRYTAYDSSGGWVSGCKIVFDDPAEETMFRLKWA